MVQVLFYRGHDLTPEGAVGKALQQCAEILVNNPSLVVQLESLDTSGGVWDADIRIMALKETAEDSRVPRKKERPTDKNVRNPEHAKFGNPFAWRPAGMDHDPPPVAFRFGNAAVAGALPDIPLQDIRISRYDLARSGESELKRILFDLEQLRLAASRAPEPDPE